MSDLHVVPTAAFTGPAVGIRHTLETLTTTGSPHQAALLEEISALFSPCVSSLGSTESFHGVRTERYNRKLRV